jgi:hypothetical protein
MFNLTFTEALLRAGGNGYRGGVKKERDERRTTS